MKALAQLLNEMSASGVIENYALRLAGSHGLSAAWRKFETRFLDE